MGIFDALSGKIYRWNQKTASARREVCRNLERYVAAELARDPKSEKVMANVRDDLFCFFDIANYGISKELDRSLDQYRDRLYSLSPQEYLSFISALHAFSVVAANAANESNAIVAYVLLGGVEAMYGRPTGFAHNWFNCFEWLAPDSEKDFRSALRHKLEEEICCVLGTKFDIVESLLWPMLSLVSAEGAARMLEEPNITAIVDEMMANAKK
ncbi:MAG: hypothetical protein ABIP48_09040 [Planctomycetota bacterium]